MADVFTTADERNLLSQPGFFYDRAFGSNTAWNKSVFMNGSTYQVNTDTAEIAFEDVGTVRDEVSDETVSVSISAGQVLDLSLIERLTGGLYQIETVDGVYVPGYDQTVAEGDWEFDTAVMFEKANFDGAVPLVNSVTGGTDGALIAGTDYFVMAVTGGYAITFPSGGATTDNQDMVINYDYTPADKTIIKRGGIKIIEPIELAFQTIGTSQITGEDEYITFYFYKAYSDGNIGHGFSPENSADPITMDLSFTVKKDINRDNGDQLYSCVRGDDYLG